MDNTEISAVVVTYSSFISCILQCGFYPFIISNVLYQPKFLQERMPIENDKNEYIGNDRNSLKKFFYQTLNQYINEKIVNKTLAPLKFDDQKIIECKDKETQ